MIKGIAVTVAVSMSLATSTVAGGVGSLQNGSDAWVPVVSLSAGPAWTNSNDSQTFFLTPQIENTYAGTKKTSVLADVELFIGWQTPFQRLFLWQGGVALVVASHATLNGVMWEASDPHLDPNNTTYSYEESHAHAAVKTTLLLNYWRVLQPYVSGSLGLAFNRSSNFTSASMLPEESLTPGFQPRDTVALTYTVGAGVQTTLTNHWQVHVGYEFADWGKSSLDRTPWQTVNSGLSLNHLYTNALLFGITYTA